MRGLSAGSQRRRTQNWDTGRNETLIPFQPLVPTLPEAKTLWTSCLSQKVPHTFSFPLKLVWNGFVSLDKPKREGWAKEHMCITRRHRRLWWGPEGRGAGASRRGARQGKWGICNTINDKNKIKKINKNKNRAYWVCFRQTTELTQTEQQTHQQGLTNIGGSMPIHCARRAYSLAICLLVSGAQWVFPAQPFPPTAPFRTYSMRSVGRHLSTHQRYPSTGFSFAYLIFPTQFQLPQRQGNLHIFLISMQEKKQSPKKNYLSK